MAEYTENLQLYKKDPVTDGADTFNIKTMLNENWDKIDEAHKEAKESFKDYIPTSQKGVANGVAELGADGKVPTAQLPAQTEVQDATTMVKGISTLGASGGAARYGYKADVGLGNVDNTSDANKPVSTATQTAINALNENITTANVAALSAQDAAANAASTAESAQAAADTASAQAAYYGTSATAAGTAGKVVTSSGFTLVTGARIAVYFTYANTATSPTLNVNGTTAKTISRLSNWEAGATVIFVYDGTYWCMVETVSQKSFYGTCATVAATVAKVVTCTAFSSGSLIVGASVVVTFTYANTAASPTLNVNSTGAKYIYVDNALAASGAWNAGQQIEFRYDGTYWRMVGSVPTWNNAVSAVPISGTVSSSASAQTVTLAFTPSLLYLSLSLGSSAIYPLPGTFGIKLVAGTTYTFYLRYDNAGGTSAALDAVTIVPTTTGFTITNATGLIAQYIAWR